MTKKIGTVLLAGLLLTACSPQDPFDQMMTTSREGRDKETLQLAEGLLGDPQTPDIVKARTEMTVALVHIRSKQWTEARAALSRAKDLGLESDTGYFKDQLPQYEAWIPGAH